MSRKMPKSLISWLMPKLRRASMYWPGKSIAREQAKIQVQEGVYQNGNPIFRTYYLCAECERQEVEIPYHVKENTAMDHIKPVVDVSGFDGDWNKVLNTLFCDPENYQCLCKEHHNEKSKKENIQRKTIKRSFKVKSSKQKITNKKKKRLTNKRK